MFIRKYEFGCEKLWEREREREREREGGGRRIETLIESK